METDTSDCKLHDCTLASVLPVGIFHTDVTGHYLSVNEYWCEIAGITVAEAQGSSWAQLLYPDDQERVFAEWERATQQKIPFRCEYRVQRPDGKTTWVLDQAVAEKDETGTVRGYVGTITDITQYKHAEEALRSTQEFLVKLLDYTPAPIYMVTADEQRYRLVNRAWEELVGIQREEVIGYSIDELFPSAVTQQFKVVNQQVIDMDDPIIAEEFVDVADGRHYFHTVKFPIKDALGQIEAIGGSSIDITQRKQAEEALRHSEERFRQMAENIHEVFWMADPELTQMLYVSPAYESIWGRTCASLYAQPRSFIEAIHPDDWKRVLAAFEQHRQSGFSHEYRIIQPDGSVRWIWERGFPVRNQAGQLESFVGVSQDISERKQMEEALRESEARFRLLAENSTDMISRHTPQEGIFLYASPACQTLLGYMPEELVGHLAYEFFHPDDLAQIRKSHATILDLPVTYTVAYRHRCKDGHYIWLETTCRTIRDQQTGAVLEIQSASRDITERKRAEEALRQQVKREQLMTRMTQRIHQSLNLEEILNITVAETRQFLECDRVLIYRMESHQSGVVIVESVASGWRSISGTIINDCYFAQNYFQLYQQGRIQALEDIYTANLSPCHVDLLVRFQVRANLVVPIVQEEGLWGLLVAQQCSGTRQWQPSEIDLLRSLATQAAIALQQAELYQQSRMATQTALTQAQQLEQAMIELQRTQAQLVQSEKMSSLGQLVAGVAHEINNPVTFISANLSHAENYTQDLLGLIQLYQEQYPHPAPEISSKIEAIELEFLIEDLPKLLDSMKIGAERICEIISALRNFSRHAEAEIKTVDIHEGLESTLMILQHRLKASGKHPEIQVIKQYGNLPLVECYVGQLNQVFMNLLSNAIDALEELNVERLKLEGLTPCIRITTELLNNREIAIRIADNGLGMTKQVKEKIFDPFYSTKAVGTGMGLGLSISYQIVVEKHGGQLHCESILGQGTEFVIQIPLGQRENRVRGVD
jgi:PAS domain S-box-containing protein